MKKKFAMLFLAVLLFVNVLPVAAAGDSQIVPYASDYLDGCAITTVPEGNRKITVEYTVYGTREMTELGATKVQIQRYDTTKKDWVDYTPLAGSSTKNDSTHTASVSFYGTVGVKYRAMIYAFAKKGTGGDSKQYDGSGVVCK